MSPRFERKQVRKHGEERVFTHVHVQDRFNFELTVYAADQAHYVFKSSITGKPIERASIRELEELLAREYPELNVEEAVREASEQVDRFQVFESLLLPLENVKQNLKWHPEGEALYHSLQVFDHARDQLPYDEDFLLAALLARCGQGNRSPRPRRRRTGGVGRLHYRAHGLADRASHGGPASASTKRSALGRGVGWRKRKATKSCCCWPSATAPAACRGSSART